MWHFKEKDIRLKILLHFEGLEGSSKETIANNYLAGLENDLGSIRRTLIELIQEDFIRLSSIQNENPIKWLNRELDTTTHDRANSQKYQNKKSSKRFLKHVGNQSKIPKIRLYVTLKGLLFIKEYKRFKYHYIWVLAIALISFFLGLIVK